MLAVSYMNEEGTNLYRVRCLGQTIVVSRQCLVSRIGMNPRCTIGYNQLTIEQANSIGFVLHASEFKKIV